MADARDASLNKPIVEIFPWPAAMLPYDELVALPSCGDLETVGTDAPVVVEFEPRRGKQNVKWSNPLRRQGRSEPVRDGRYVYPVAANKSVFLEVTFDNTHVVTYDVIHSACGMVQLYRGNERSCAAPRDLDLTIMWERSQADHSVKPKAS